MVVVLQARRPVEKNTLAALAELARRKRWSDEYREKFGSKVFVVLNRADEVDLQPARSTNTSATTAPGWRRSSTIWSSRCCPATGRSTRAPTRRRSIWSAAMARSTPRSRSAGLRRDPLAVAQPLLFPSLKERGDLIYQAYQTIAASLPFAPRPAAGYDLDWLLQMSGVPDAQDRDRRVRAHAALLVVAGTGRAGHGRQPHADAEPADALHRGAGRRRPTSTTATGRWAPTSRWPGTASTAAPQPARELHRGHPGDAARLPQPARPGQGRPADPAAGRADAGGQGQAGRVADPRRCRPAPGRAGRRHDQRPAPGAPAWPTWSARRPTWSTRPASCRPTGWPNWCSICGTSWTRSSAVSAPDLADILSDGFESKLKAVGFEGKLKNLPTTSRMCGARAGDSYRRMLADLRAHYTDMVRTVLLRDLVDPANSVEDERSTMLKALAAMQQPAAAPGGNGRRSPRLPTRSAPPSGMAASWAGSSSRRRSRSPAAAAASPRRARRPPAPSSPRATASR